MRALETEADTYSINLGYNCIALKVQNTNEKNAMNFSSFWYE
jgi:hypothetical protein